MAQRLPPTKIVKPLGRGTRLAIPFQWRGADGQIVDLAGGGFTAQVWVSTPAGGITATSPHAVAPTGTQAVYQMSAEDLATASATATDYILFTCVATAGETRLPPIKLAVNVADWTGADDMLGVQP
jgi:hypothetical protein